MENHSKDTDSFYNLFIPLTSKKAIIFIVIIGFLVFFNMLFNGIVWDDITFIMNDPVIYTFNIFRLFGYNMFNYGGYFRPIPAVYFSILYNLFGQKAFFYHFFQLCLHIVDSCLLFYFFKKFFKITISFFLVLIFLIHPIQVESVAYIGASQSELLFLFGMTAILISMRERQNIFTLLSMSCSLLLALLTKETAILFPVMILLYVYIFSKKHRFLFLPITVSIVFFYLFIRLFLAHIPFQQNLTTPISKLSLIWRVLNIPSIFFYYIKTFFYPSVLGIDQRWIVTKLNVTQFYLPLFGDLLFFIVVGIVGYLCRKKNKELFKYYLYFSLWFFLGMGVLMQLVPLDMTVSERWFYLPIVGLLGIVGLAFSLIKIETKRIKYFSYSILILVVLLLGIRTVVRNTNWYDPVILYEHDIRIDENPDLDLILGAQLEADGRFSEALPYLFKTERQNPSAITISNIGVAYAALGEGTKAVYYYNKALTVGALYPGATPDTMVYINLGVFYLNNGKPSLAEIVTKKALQKYPSNDQLWLLLSVAEYHQGFNNEALTDIKKAYLINPRPLYLQYYNSMSRHLQVEIQ